MITSSQLKYFLVEHDFGQLLSYSLSEAGLNSDAYTMHTSKGKFVILRTSTPFRIGGGIHLKIYLPIATQYIGECALFVTRNKTGKTVLPKVRFGDSYWVFFKSVKKQYAGKATEKFVTYKGGQEMVVDFQQGRNGEVIEVGAPTSRLPTFEYAVFYSTDEEPVHLA